MPTYQYACTECGHAFEQVQSFSDDALTVCPECEGRLRKVFNAVGVVFKGSGFYRTDSRGKARRRRGRLASASHEDRVGESDDSKTDVDDRRPRRLVLGDVGVLGVLVQLLDVHEVSTAHRQLTVLHSSADAPLTGSARARSVASVPVLLLRLRSAARRVRRAVLRRRRLLAALCALVAVLGRAPGHRRAAAADRVPVTVAAHDLGAGAVLRPDDLTTRRGSRPARCPSGHIRDPVGRQLAGPLRRGQPITDTALLGAGAGPRPARPGRAAGPAARHRDGRAAPRRRRGRPAWPPTRRAARPRPWPARRWCSRSRHRRPTRPPTGCPAGWWCSASARPSVTAVSSASVTHFLTVAWSR